MPEPRRRTREEGEGAGTPGRERPVYDVRDVLGGAVARLRSARVPEPRREADRLWRDIVGQAAALSAIRGGPGAELIERFLAAVARRATGEPLAYVTGVAGFRRLQLRSDRRALIPRPETEGIIDLSLARVRTGIAADIGTGSGCLALSLADEGSFALVVAVDNSAPALELARENRALTGRRIELSRGDLVAPLATNAFDLIVSNPPYLTVEEYAGLDPSVRNWEPVPALQSGQDGMDATRRLLADARRPLRAGGWLVAELDCTRAALAADDAIRLGWAAVAIHDDLFGRARYLTAQRSDVPC